MARLVYCVKLKHELPGLAALPFPGELGQRIFDHVSAEGYALWQPYATMLINHNGLSLANPQHRDWLVAQMEDFFFSDDAPMPEGWMPQGQAQAPAKGKGGGGAPQRK